MGVLKGFDAASVTKERAVVGRDRHNIVRPGLNYMGRCNSASCAVRGNSVVHPRGAGTFIVNDDIMSQVPVCPICKTPFEVLNLVLHQCTAKATVLRHTEETAEYVAKGADELLLIAATKPPGMTSTPALPLQSDALLTMAVRVTARGSD